MSSQSAHYTLPGVMHYLQTEYTRNERDRINWELERCEMKAKIAQLEGENKDLRYQLLKLKSKMEEPVPDEPALLESWDHEDELMSSRLSVQENVKEIVYLLKSPHVTEQLEAWNNKDSPVKNLESLNFYGNGKSSKKLSDNGDFFSEDPDGNHSITSIRNEEIREVDDLTQSEVATIVNSERPRSSSLFSTKSNESVRFQTFQILKFHLSPISKLNLLGNNMLSFGSDGLLKHWLIEPNLNSNEKSTTSFHSVPNLLGIFWLSRLKFITVEQNCIKIWKTDQSEPLLSWDTFNALTGLQSIDFKNKWLILGFETEIKIWELKITDSSVAKLNEFSIKIQEPVLKCLFGLTEKSVIVLNGSKRKNIKVSIYDFQGSLLQNIDLSRNLSEFHPTDNQLALNRSTSKLLVRFGGETLIYSFDQKRTVLVSSTGRPTVSSIFVDETEYTATALDDGTIMVKSINENGKLMKKYNHYDDPDKVPTDAQPINIASTVINSAPVIVSGGYDGTIRLEQVLNIP